MLLEEALVRVVGVCQSLATILPLMNRPGRPPVKDEDLLRDPRRRELVEFIAAHPGLPPTEIMDALQLGGGTFYHHLEKLEAAGILERKVVAGRVRVYPTGAAPDKREGVLASEVLLRVARFLVEAGSATSLEIAAHMGVSRRMALNYLSALTEAGWVGTEGRGKNQRYCPKPALVARIRQP